MLLFKGGFRDPRCGHRWFMQYTHTLYDAHELLLVGWGLLRATTVCVGACGNKFIVIVSFCSSAI